MMRALLDTWRYLWRCRRDERPVRPRSAHGPWLGVTLTMLASVVVGACILGRATCRPAVSPAEPNVPGGGPMKDGGRSAPLTVPVTRRPASDSDRRGVPGEAPVPSDAGPGYERNPPGSSCSPALKSGGMGPEPGKTVQVPLLLDMRRSAPPAANCPSSRAESGSGPQDVAAERRGVSAKAPALAALLDAIRHAESGGRDRPSAGDGGRSIGRFQIGEAYWRDACKYGGVRWDWRTGAWNDAQCRRVILWYAARYGAKTPEEIARCHNAGPTWRTRARAATANYWRRVSAAKEN